MVASRRNPFEGSLGSSDRLDGIRIELADVAPLLGVRGGVLISQADVHRQSTRYSPVVVYVSCAIVLVQEHPWCKRKRSACWNTEQKAGESVPRIGCGNRRVRALAVNAVKEVLPGRELRVVCVHAE